MCIKRLCPIMIKRQAFIDGRLDHGCRWVMRWRAKRILK